ncbi:MAG: DUF3710 domain-containing protein [Actinomycetota bacterium]|nr:DUF3710 domain-containing protein [Actinomycetota bacterium]
MIFRRRDRGTRPPSDEATGDPVVDAAVDDEGTPTDGRTGDVGADVTGEDYRRAVGPWDGSERTVDPADPGSIDLGGIVVQARPGFELRLQTDQESGDVQAVLLVAEDGAAELRAFAAARNTSLWEGVRAEIAADASRRGGTATDLDGRYGTELRVKSQVRTPDGKTGTQTSRIVGIGGPRWLLRVTYLGKPAVQPDPQHVLEAAVRDLVVVRGDVAMPPREQIPLRLPAGARPVTDAPDDPAQ